MTNSNQPIWLLLAMLIDKITRITRITNIYRPRFRLCIAGRSMAVD